MIMFARSCRPYVSELVSLIIFSYIALTVANDAPAFQDTYDVDILINGRSVETTLTQTGHRKQISLVITAFSRTFTIDLLLNTHLFATHYVEKSISKSGVMFHQSNHSSSHCFYTGSVRNEPQSSAAVSTCRGIEGYFVVGNETYHISPRSGRNLKLKHRIYRTLNDSLSRWACGASSSSRANTIERLRRSLPYPQNRDRSIDVIEFYVAVDYSEYTNYNSDLNAMYKRTKDIVNVVSSLYQLVDVYVVLVGVEVWQSSNLISITSDSTATLNNWYTYRRTSINPYHYNDNAFLLTNTYYDGSIVGKANVGSMCSFMSSGGIVTDASSNVGVVGQIMTHEMGHNFGLLHDGTSSSCPCDDPSGNCIMSPQTSLMNTATKFSSCSKSKLQDAKNQRTDSCLKNMPQTVFQNSPLCGNGIIDDGEQCDCGKSPNQECNSGCCNNSTCQLIQPATCAGGMCCDVNRCQLQPVGFQCRSSNDVCDLEEYCNGASSLCPVDSYKHDGTSCTAAGTSANCYHGLCRSQQSQCQLLWGSSTNNAYAACYTRLNVRNDEVGNCGVSGWGNSGIQGFIPCDSQDVMCGKLQCDSSNPQLTSYNTFYSQISATIGTARCYSIIFDFGQQVPDPGLVPDGSPCGSGGMCISQKCVSVNSTLQQTACPVCRNGGICNNFGHCHCPSGYGPPDCSGPGPGGSPDSGPISSILSASTTSTTSSSTSSNNQTMDGGSSGSSGFQWPAVGFCVFLVLLVPFIIVGIVCAVKNHKKIVTQLKKQSKIQPGYVSPVKDVHPDLGSNGYALTMESHDYAQINSATVCDNYGLQITDETSGTLPTRKAPAPPISSENTEARSRIWTVPMESSHFHVPSEGIQPGYVSPMKDVHLVHGSNRHTLTMESYDNAQINSATVCDNYGLQITDESSGIMPTRKAPAPPISSEKTEARSPIWTVPMESRHSHVPSEGRQMNGCLPMPTAPVEQADSSLYANSIEIAHSNEVVHDPSSSTHQPPPTVAAKPSKVSNKLGQLWPPVNPQPAPKSVPPTPPAKLPKISRIEPGSSNSPPNPPPKPTSSSDVKAPPPTPAKPYTRTAAVEKNPSLTFQGGKFRNDLRRNESNS